MNRALKFGALFIMKHLYKTEKLWYNEKNYKKKEVSLWTDIPIDYVCVTLV